MNPKKLYRAIGNEKKIAGVCGGIANYLNCDPTIIRVIWAVAILTWGVGLVAYIACAFIIPEWRPEE